MSAILHLYHLSSPALNLCVHAGDLSNGSSNTLFINSYLHEDIPSLILVLVISLIVIFAYLPLQELFSFLKKKKGILIDGLDQKITEEKIPEKKTELILKRDELIKQNLIYSIIL